MLTAGPVSLMEQVEDLYAEVGYIREVVDEKGTPGFALFDADGSVVCCSIRRSDCFFAAAENEIRVIMLN